MHHVNLIGQRADLRTDLLLRWKFDEVSGNAIDSSGNGYTGTVSGATQDQLGHLNRAYSFDEVNDDVLSTAAGLVAAMQNINVFTIAGWASASAFANFKCGFSVTEGGNNELGIYPYNDIGGNGMSVWYNGESIFAGAGSHLANGDFNHFCYRQNGATSHEVFVNGVSVATDATSKTMIGTIDTINAGSFGGFEFFGGLLDDWDIWTRTLTNSQILTLAQM